MSHIDDCSDKNSSIQNCSVAKTILIIGKKWTIHIIHYLFNGPRRFSELLRYLETISPKTLSQRLGELESQEIVTRKVFPEVPLHVEYSLTSKGKTLKGIFDQMENWGENHS